MMKAYLMALFPSVYDGFREVDLLAGAEAVILDDAVLEIERACANQYIVSANETGITAFENILSISANPFTESLDFRRARLLNRYSLRAPLSTPFLRQRLNDIIGAGKYLLTIDYDGYTLTIESSAEDQQWFQEIIVTVGSVKPANMRFVNRPLISKAVHVGEEISIKQSVLNYRLGTTWRLGALPFETAQKESVIKLASIASVQDRLFTDVAAFIASDVGSVLLNGWFAVTDFRAKYSAFNITEIEYDVFRVEMTDPAITNVQLLDDEGRVLTNATVYVPMAQDVVMKHLITTKEGV